MALLDLNGKDIMVWFGLNLLQKSKLLLVKLVYIDDQIKEELK